MGHLWGEKYQAAKIIKKQEAVTFDQGAVEGHSEPALIHSDFRKLR